MEIERGVMRNCVVGSVVAVKLREFLDLNVLGNASDRPVLMGSIPRISDFLL